MMQKVHSGAAAMLARAFAEDPAMVWLFPDPSRRLAALPLLFALMLRSDAAAGRCDPAAGGASLAAWRAPGHTRVGAGEMLRSAIPLARLFGRSLPRALSLEAAIQRRHPPAGFWYLHILGTDPAARGRGHASSLLRAGVARAAVDGVPCVLETANAANLRFYLGHGFAVTAEWRMPGGPRFWTMRREPPNPFAAARG